MVVPALILAAAAIAIGWVLGAFGAAGSATPRTGTQVDVGTLTRSVAGAVLPRQVAPKIVIRGPSIVRSDRELLESLLADLLGYTPGGSAQVAVLVELVGGDVQIQVGHESALHVVAAFDEMVREKAQRLGGTLRSAVLVPGGVRFVLTLPGV